MLFHPDPTKFIEESNEYGALGCAMIELSNLEFSHDQFIFAMYERHRDISLSFTDRFPRHFKHKTDFLIHSILHVSDLRKIPVFPTGELNLLWLQYQFDEIYGIRSMIAHGSVFYSESTPDRITWTFERYVQKDKHTWATESVKISNGFLASVQLTAHVLKHYLVSLTHCLQGISCWEKDYQADKDIRENRKFIAELSSLKVISDDGWINAFPPLGPIE